MLWDLVLAFLAAVGFLLILWCLIGSLLHPVFSSEMVTFLTGRGSGEKLEQRIRAFAWLRDGRVSGGKLIVVDCGLDEQGVKLAHMLCQKYDWVILCAPSEVGNYIAD